MGRCSVDSCNLVKVDLEAECGRDDVKETREQQPFHIALAQLAACPVTSLAGSWTILCQAWDDLVSSFHLLLASQIDP